MSLKCLEVHFLPEGLSCRFSERVLPARWLLNLSSPKRYKDGRAPLNGLYEVDGIRGGVAHPKLFILRDDDNVVPFEREA